MDGTQSRAPARTYPVMTRREIEALIAEGRNIIIKDQHVLKVDAWMKYHPGGDKAIQHMIGRDATDEVNAYVLSTPELRSLLAHPPGLTLMTAFILPEPWP